MKTIMVERVLKHYVVLAKAKHIFAQSQPFHHKMGEIPTKSL